MVVRHNNTGGTVDDRIREDLTGVGKYSIKGANRNRAKRDKALAAIE